MATRRFSPDARSEALLTQLEAWCAAHGLPPKVDPSAFLRLGLELLAIETQRRSDSEHPDAARRGLARQIESAAAGQKAEGAPQVRIESPEEAATRRQRWEETQRRVDELVDNALAERRQRRRKEAT